MSGWTKPADLRAQVERLWRSGRLLAGTLSGEEIFPHRLTLKAPRPKEIAERFGEVRAWAGTLRAGKHYRLVDRQVNNRVLGTNSLPAEAWVDSRAAALSIVGKHREAAEFEAMVELTREQVPELLEWLQRRPLKALGLAPVWPRLLAVVAWLRLHPRPGIYLRQVDIPGVDTKLIELHRSVLAELFDLALPAQHIAPEFTGAALFTARYGFRDKPLRVRFRLLDPGLGAELPVADESSAGRDDDVTLTVRDFAALRLPTRRVFITENEVNFLAFPAVPASIAVFGGGLRAGRPT